MSCPQDLKRLAIRSRIRLSRQSAYLVEGLLQYACHRLRISIEIPDEAIQLFSSLNERFVGMAIVSNQEQETQIGSVLRLASSKQGNIDLVELNQFRGVDKGFPTVEVHQFNVLVGAGPMCDQVLKTDPLCRRQPACDHGLFIAWQR